MQTTDAERTTTAARTRNLFIRFADNRSQLSGYLCWETFPAIPANSALWKASGTRDLQAILDKVRALAPFETRDLFFMGVKLNVSFSLWDNYCSGSRQNNDDGKDCNSRY